jgi:hypothetical protein
LYQRHCETRVRKPPARNDALQAMQQNKTLKTFLMFEVVR